MEKKRIFIEGIGDITIRENPRATNIGIRIKPMEGVILTVPKGVSLLKALKFVEIKKSWIGKHLDKFSSMNAVTLPLDADAVYSICGYELIALQHKGDNHRIRIVNKTIYVYYPMTSECKSEEFQNAVRKGVVEALRKEAKDYLPQKVHELAEKHGFKYEKVRIKNAKTRWGSCSTKKNINLNLHLMRLPEQLRDYVILHELVHTEHPNHGKKFWETLDNLIINARTLEKELKEHQIRLF